MRVLAALLVLSCPGVARADCRLCAGGAASTQPPRPQRPLELAIDTALDFSRAALFSSASGGTIELDARTGSRTVQGLRDLGGVTVLGRVRLTGQPFARVRLSLPPSVTLSSSDGGRAEVTNIRANAPDEVTLDAGGSFEFRFGGRLTVTGGMAGDFRGRIPVTADYP